MIAPVSGAWHPAQMTAVRLALALVAASLPAQSVAQDASAFSPSGLYIFRTEQVADGQPVCSELWEFGPDGALAVESGAERLTKAFRIETDRDGTWIVMRTLTTNGEPDCMGGRTPEPPPGERRRHILPMNNGVILLCADPTHTADGIPVTSVCYAQLIPADQVG